MNWELNQLWVKIAQFLNSGHMNSYWSVSIISAENQLKAKIEYIFFQSGHLVLREFFSNHAKLSFYISSIISSIISKCTWFLFSSQIHVNNNVTISSNYYISRMKIDTLPF